MERKYVVKTLSLSGKGNKIYHDGDVIAENDIPGNNVRKLLDDGAIEALPTDSDELADEVETTDVADETTEETATEQTTETVEAEVETTQAETEVVEDKPAKGKPIKKGGKKATK